MVFKTSSHKRKISCPQAIYSCSKDKNELILIQNNITPTVDVRMICMLYKSMRGYNMKNLKKIALVTAVSAMSTGSYAELKSLDDMVMRDISGQAGLTIDSTTKFEVGEVAYQDAGFLLFQGFRMGGNSFSNGTGTAGSFLDNLRINIDVAGDGTGNDNVLPYGFSNMREIGQLYVDEGNVDVVFADVASGVDSTRGNIAIDAERTYDDGDLVMHFDFTDGFANEGGFDQYRAAGRFISDDYHTAELVLEHAVDFRFEIDAIGIAKSSYVVGSAGLDIDGNHTTGLHEGSAGTTTLISQLGIQGYLGPEDFIVTNDGNGFGADGSGVDLDGNGLPDSGTGNADSTITFSRYFKITDLDMYIDIAGVQIRDMELHNERGDRTGLDGTSSFDFAHSVLKIFAVKDAVVNMQDFISGGTGYVDGIALNTRFKGEIDIHHLSFGDTGNSIGEIFITDMESTTNWTISAH